jgi:hypothetical protein
MAKFSYVHNRRRCAFDALKKPSDFGYWGPKNTFKTWGFCGIQKNSQSTILEQANYKAITKHLKSKYPNDCRTESFNHWAAGELEQLVVKVVDLPDDYDKNLLEEYLQDDGNITSIFMEVLEYHDNLQDEPIYDEDLYYEMLFDAAVESVKYWAECNTNLVCLPNIDTMKKIVTELQEYGVYLDTEESDYSDEEMMHGFYNLHLWNVEGKDKWFEWCDKHNLARPPFDLESISRWNPNQFNLFEETHEDKN